LLFYRNEWGIGIGEAAPIEGFHPIRYDDVYQSLYSALHESKRQETHTIPAIVHNTIEMAKFNGLQQGRVLLNGLYTKTQSVDPQFGCYKIKVGRQSVEDDIQMLFLLSKQIPQDTPIRLDANCAWTWDECHRFWKGIIPFSLNIEYIEEPLKNPLLYPNLHIPFALDERLSDFSDSLSHLSYLRAIILKPSLLGFHACIDWMKKAKNLGISAVISSTFESSIGLYAYAQLALMQPNTHAGLATGSWFAEDLISNRALATDGFLTISNPHHQTINWNHLTLEKESH
jgi:O-succinylbenzoate synthase